MRNLMLSWQQATVVTVVLAVIAGVCTLSRTRSTRVIAPFAREAAIIAGLYSLWQLAGELSVVDSAGAFRRARWIEHAEHTLHLPSEASVQRVLTGNTVTAHFANIYYATMHFTVLGVFLVWLFVRHRDQYVEIRRVLAVTTFLCLVIQLIPVAPPRLLPGFVDTAQKYGESVYGFGFGADELSAMPSVHVAWAVLIGWAVWRIGSGPWRWIGPLHTVVTVLVVVSTANHFWADGVVATAVLIFSVYLCRGVERAAAAALARVRHAAPAGAELRSRAGSGILP